MMSYLSLALDLRGWPVLIVGAGNRVAGRRARLLIDEGARITVVAPEVGTDIAALAATGRLSVLQRRYADQDLGGMRLVIAATDDDALNRRIASTAQAQGILANCASKGSAGEVIFPARYRSRGVEVAVHDQGGSVRRVLHVRDRIAAVLEGSGELASPLPPPEGMVYLVGAGPGAPDLLTLRALRAIQAADLVVIDRILGDDFVQRLDLDCRGKEVVNLEGGTESPARQLWINDLLVREARHGRVIARVKNGDPLVFGRGGEEAAWLSQHGVRWEFIPGLSSSISLLTMAGHPITDRGNGRSFAVVSARLAGGAMNERFPHADSLVFLMGFKVLSDIRTRLLAEGWAADTPCAIIERGGLPFEQRMMAPLSGIVELAAAQQVDSPAILAVGNVARIRYAAAERPVLLFTGADPTAWRALGDLLHWPALRADGSPHPELGKPLPPHDGVCFVDAAAYAAWKQAYGTAALAAGVWASAAAAEVIAADGVTCTMVAG